jgi:(R,R)-butanediol dehydrogenase / meso-butanediol dehydrogenase / diacetyl reductase
MKALVWYGKQDVRVEDVNEPVVETGKVKIKPAFTGICGSDLHAYHHGIGVQVNEAHPISGQKAPLTLGHEFAGVVTEVGDGVTNIQVGDRVAVEPMLHCGECEYCKQGRYNMCGQFGFVGLNADGGFAEYVVVESKLVHKLPDSVSLEEGALVEPTAVAVQAVRESKIKVGDTVAVYGVGPIGLLTIMAAKAAGAARIIAVDVSIERLEKAKEVGATHIINSLEEDPTSVIHSTYGGVDVAYEAAGVQPTLTSAIQVVKKGGEVMVIAVFGKPAEVDMFALVAHEITIKGSLAYRHIFPQVINMIENGVLDVKKVVTDKISLDNVVKDGFEKLLTDKSQAKILVEIK